MGYFARVNNGVVEQVISASQDFIDSYVSTAPGEWIKTSYNTRGGVHYARDENGQITGASEDQSKALRKNYAGVGYIYDVDRDAFYEPQPFPSWTLNETTCQWEPPVAHPTDGEIYVWNEGTSSWDAE
jgi:hypothetical protein